MRVILFHVNLTSLLLEPLERTVLALHPHFSNVADNAVVMRKEDVRRTIVWALAKCHPQVIRLVLSIFCMVGAAAILYAAVVNDRLAEAIFYSSVGAILFALMAIYAWNYAALCHRVRPQSSEKIAFDKWRSMRFQGRVGRILQTATSMN
jgi:hypothetical protein